MALTIVAEGDGACKIAYCRVCLDAFKQIEGRGRPRKRCVVCQRANKRTEKKPYTGRRRRSYTYTCQTCGELFHPFEKAKNKYCSHKCAFAGLRIDRRVKREERQARLLAAKPDPFSLIHLCACRVCTKAFYSKHQRSALCSSACAKVDACKRTFEYNARFKEVKAVNCKECGSTFTAQYGDGRRIFCSHACSVKSARRISRPKQRARLRAVRVEAVDPLKVFARDGWRCQICHRLTPQQMRGTTHDRAPELDHIIPLSKGGEHSYRNTQCACRKCNGAKSAAIYGQLNLFAS